MDALRALLLAPAARSYGLELDFAILAAATAAALVVGGRLYSTTAT